MYLGYNSFNALSVSQRIHHRRCRSDRENTVIESVCGIGERGCKSIGCISQNFNVCGILIDLITRSLERSHIRKLCVGKRIFITSDQTGFCGRFRKSLIGQSIRKEIFNCGKFFGILLFSDSDSTGFRCCKHTSVSVAVNTLCPSISGIRRYL